MAKGSTTIKLRFRFIALLFLAGALAVGAIFYAQEQKLKEIRAEQTGLQSKYDALQNEKQRTELMIEYSLSNEYLLEFAREKLGLIGENEILFNIVN